MDPNNHCDDTSKKETDKTETKFFLEHLGPRFPQHERLPDDVKLSYDGKEIKLSKNAEKIATLFASIMHRPVVKGKKFRQNFFGDWKKQMTKEEKKEILYLEKCDFMAIRNFLENEAGSASVEEYYCTYNGSREKVVNFKIEPTIFIGRGKNKHLSGKLNIVNPEDVIINCSADSEVPKCPGGGTWKKKIHNDKVMYLAKWKNKVAGHWMYMRLHPNAEIKQQREREKFISAQKLGGHIRQVRMNYKKAWESDDIKEKQLGVALYLVDKLALRRGEGIKSIWFGCFSLRKEHLNISDIKGKNSVEFDFIGKDNVRFHRTVTLDKKVCEFLKSFIDGSNEKLFDKITADDANKYLKKKYYDELTLKVFRTFHACKIFQAILKVKTKEGLTQERKLNAFVEALFATSDYLNLKTNFSWAQFLMIRRLFSIYSIVRPRLRSEFCIQKTFVYILSNALLCFIDPRIVVTWCNQNGIDIDLVYTKGELEQHAWAIDEIKDSIDFVF